MNSSITDVQSLSLVSRREVLAPTSVMIPSLDPFDETISPTGSAASWFLAKVSMVISLILKDFPVSRISFTLVFLSWFVHLFIVGLFA